MMRVTGTFWLRGRVYGPVACVETDGPCPLNWSVLRRSSDGKLYVVRGVERFGLRLGTVGVAGEKVGLLLSGETAIGDELERFPQ